MPVKQVVQVPGSKTIGPYSQAVRAGGLLFVSGQPGIDLLRVKPPGRRLRLRLAKHSRTWIPFFEQGAAGSIWR